MLSHNIQMCRGPRGKMAPSMAAVALACVAFCLLCTVFVSCRTSYSKEALLYIGRSAPSSIFRFNVQRTFWMSWWEGRWSSLVLCDGLGSSGGKEEAVLLVFAGEDRVHLSQVYSLEMWTLFQIKWMNFGCWSRRTSTSTPRLSSRWWRHI